MIMGGLNGLTIFDPTQITKNLIPPTVILSGLKVNNKPVTKGCRNVKVKSQFKC